MQKKEEGKIEQTKEVWYNMELKKLHCLFFCKEVRKLQNRKKKRRKANYVLLVISDSPTEKTKRYHLSRARMKFIKIMFAMMFLALIGYIGFTSYHNTIVMSRETALKMKLGELDEKNAQLQEENEQLLDKVSILSKTVNEKVDAEKVQEEKNMPSGFPLSGTADVEETEEVLEMDDGEIVRPMILFHASDGISVVAAGAGVVSYVELDNKYGYQVFIDHGNGYTTVYRSGTEPKVKEGDEVARGALLYEMKEDEDNELADDMAYQVIKDGEYIKPTDVLEING